LVLISWCFFPYFPFFNFQFIPFFKVSLQYPFLLHFLKFNVKKEQVLVCFKFVHEFSNNVDILPKPHFSNKLHIIIFLVGDFLQLLYFFPKQFFTFSLMHLKLLIVPVLTS
tara:strand:+ start:127 stop:459 length:333 start_codon:yes stop_codon:yes gene_type:complete